MFERTKWMRCVAQWALIFVGCQGLPRVVPGATEVTYPSFERSDCSLKPDVSFTNGTLIIDSEAAFGAHFTCADNRDIGAKNGAGVDFSANLLVVFVADGKSHAPKFVRLERKGDRLTALFVTETYCGGAPPVPRLTDQAFVVPRAPLLLNSHVVTRFRRCPNNLP